MAEEQQPLVNEQAVISRFGALRNEVNQLWQKITELEMEMNEHNLVIGAIEPMEPSRRCYRLIGGVLVERTVAEVLPAVTRNCEGLKEVIGKLGEQLQKKRKELAEFQMKYKIRIKGADESTEVKESASQGQGVLVRPAEASSA
ncbi:hypothetical protein CBR_g42063 [Chara braunii]|uniref:Prefoldin subunit 2 n=1 Tax=Chara braunii TaxID=69332 RepID=A0A388LWS9_CHABU|nr:hypothetical protein CBR_g42063 [Chara braunii]|eukprot:GBG86780.1 hypothetical protein CBR_g42063 [Chara braunii]